MSPDAALAGAPRTAPDGPHLVGVRHHSPACARLVRETIRRVRPRHVLIEGPCDFNDRMDELLLDHELPIAIFSYLRSDQARHAAWAPFCEYSPEWAALQTAREVGAQPRFCDLPSWHECFVDLGHRYADRRGDEGRSGAESYVSRLCRRLSIDDPDGLWDHLFEQSLPLDELAQRLDTYFEHLRDDRPAANNDGPRERFMARSVAWAVADAGAENVVVVCGGYHAPVLAKDWRRHGSETGFPRFEPPADADCHSYLVPYSYKRLDAFAGYQSGMPSPAFYEVLWREGPEAAGDRAIELTVRRLRKKKQPISTADLIGADAMAQGLARLRGRSQPTRTDVLDGLAGALLKDGLEVPLPWSRRGPLLPRTHPLLVEIVAALSGDRRGRLDERTPQPPLLADIRRIVAELDLGPSEKGGTRRQVELDLLDSVDRRRSRALHRLAILGIPGFRRLEGPEQPSDAVLGEIWRITRHPDAEVAVIEASSWGPTLIDAGSRCLESRLAEAETLIGQANLLTSAVFAGLDAIADRCLDELCRRIAEEPSFTELGLAAGCLFDLWRHEGLFVESRREALPRLNKLLEACLDRGFWLLEGLSGSESTADPSELSALAALRDVALRLSTSEATAIFSRRSVDRTAPPAIRGGCLGALWTLIDRAILPTASSMESLEDPQALALQSLRSMRKDLLGEYLAGLFALAREITLTCEPLLEAVDSAISDLDLDTFLIALPSLRLAFSYFPPLERETLARFVLARHGQTEADAQDFLRLEVSPGAFIEGRRLDQRVAEVAARYGLLDPLDEQEPIDAEAPEVT